MKPAVKTLRDFVEEITKAGGKYKDLNGNQIVADAYKALQPYENQPPDDATVYMVERFWQTHLSVSKTLGDMSL